MNEQRLEAALREGPPDEPRYEPILGATDGLASGRPPLAAVPLRRGSVRTTIRGGTLTTLAASVAAFLAGTLVIGVLLLPTSVGPTPSATAAAPAESARPRSVSIDGLRAITGSWEESGKGGLALSVVVDGRIYEASAEFHPVSSVVRVGAVSRLYVAGLVLLLVDDGLVRLGDPVARYVPDWPGGEAITIEMLLSGSSGVAAFGEPLADLEALIEEDPGRAWNAEAALAIAAAKPPRFDPGTADGLVDTDDALLVAVIASALGGDPAAAIRERLLLPLGLRGSFTPDMPVPPPQTIDPSRDQDARNMVRGHLSRGGTSTVVDDIDSTLLGVLGIARGIGATSGDLARLSDALHTGSLLADASRARLGTGYSTGGFGGVLACPCDGATQRALVLTGDVGAYSAAVVWFADTDISLAIVADRSVGPAEFLALAAQVDAVLPR